ncbi:MAG: hypothetical protein IJ048_03760 [Clostridia bacterium]|nr:hypothetical protein [Clostridia bacterium]
MATKRMVSKIVCGNDDFLMLSPGAQALFLQLQLEADDFGFIANPKRVVRGCLRTEMELHELVDGGFCIPFPSGHIVMRHWLAANKLEKRCAPLDAEEYALLKMAGDGSYILASENFPEVPGNSGKFRDSVSSRGAQATDSGKSLSPPSLEEVEAEAKRAGLSVNAAQFLADCEADGWKDGRGEPVRDWKKWLRGYAALNRAGASSNGKTPPPALAFEQRTYTQDQLAAMTDADFEELVRMAAERRGEE